MQNSNHPQRVIWHEGNEVFPYNMKAFASRFGLSKCTSTLFSVGANKNIACARKTSFLLI